MSHAEYVERELGSALDTTRQAIQSGTGLLLAVSKLSGILYALPELEKKIQRSDFLFISAVASECDGRPSGPTQSYEQRIREDILGVLARIADDLGK